MASQSKLNIQIKCLLNFAEHFYEPLMQFLIGQDTALRIYQNGKLTKLPPGRRAHEMPDKVYEWHKFLQDLVKNFEMFFANELLEALDTLSSEEFGEFFNDLELRFAEELNDDLKKGITSDFGLNELLSQNSDFLKEFEQFCMNDLLSIYDFPNLYGFIKTRIYFIIIHQQQVEGLFNKLDLKIHPNMSLSIKQSKLRLSSSKIGKKN